MTLVYPFDDAATARAVVGEDGTLVAWNAGAQRLLGWSPAEVVGRPAANLLVSGGEDTPDGPVAGRWDGTLTLCHRDGTAVSVWLLAHHRHSSDGGPGHWLLVTPLDPGGPGSLDDPLGTAVLTQSPCAVAVYDAQL